jgi:hypothetical protein
MSSDASCEKTGAFSWHQVLKDRTFRTIALALLLIFGMGLMRPDKPVGMYPKKYWAKKIRWRHCADAVIIGDSRALMALSPVEMTKVLDYDRILNFGFGANWYARKYLETVEEVLDPKSDKKAVIIGITPLSLTFRTKGSGHFLNFINASKQDIYFDLHLAALLNFLDPMSFSDAYRGLFPSLAPIHTRKEYFADGWISVHREPTDNRRSVKKYQGVFKKLQVSPKTINVLLEFVSRWTNSGTKIYGFFMPSCKEMFELEAENSGINQSEFIKSFEQAGGIWIPVDQCCYESYDGSHLQDIGALEFSYDLAVRIHEIENDKGIVTDIEQIREMR